ncbi:amino acid adenylation domain-containing protein [Streptomyces piniterrae]|uniref:Amino acid adenylation domain-containing protein n=1 Tax=Streptomyces piniterrae TaxID=2571125 RepID=A0A4U0MT71_9ACTN|nr:amino acid adenylation domain-containing protein [Streptomyces piniterrae]TJZ44119.1 amino acid adenylation domain-containing protein [Streptomyces piniterrae]
MSSVQPAATPPARWAWRITGDRSASGLPPTLGRLAAAAGQAPHAGPGASGPVRTPEVGRIDLSHTADRSRELGAVALREAQTLDERGDALRICLVRLAEAEHALLVTAHRPMGQGELLPFVEGLLELTARQADGPGAGPGDDRLHRLLATLPDGWATAGNAARERRGPVPPLNLLADTPRRPERNHRAASVTRRISVAADFAAWCTARGFEPYEGLLAALTALLARYRDTPELTVAVDAPASAGPQAPTAPRGVRVRWTDSGTTDDLTAGLARALRAEDTGDTDRPDPAECPVLFTYAHHHGRELAAPGLHAVEFAVDSGWTDRDLGLSLQVHPDGWHLRLDHDPDAIDAHDARRLLDRLISLCARWPRERSLAELTALTDNERRQVLADWQGPEQDCPDACVHELIAAHARRTPERLAVVCGGRQLTYGELDARANRAARRLRELGAGPEAVVAVYADRSVEALTALLAVLKAGAGYVPLDPSYPEERIRYVVRDSGARLLLGAGRALAGLADLADVTTVALDGEDVLRHSAADPRPLARPSNLAYVIYTSGSTGDPKGVAVSHRSLVLSNAARAVGGPPPTVDLLTMPLCFDGAASGLYWTLVGGGTLLMPTDAEVRDPRAVAALAAAWPVSHIHSIPSYYTLLEESCGDDGLPELRFVSVGGEPLPPRLVAQHLFRHPDATLLNDYGPTEATVWAAAHPCTSADATAPLVPIGRPLPNYRLYVLDQGMRPVPPGLPGELCISGTGVARGYLGRPALTANAFLPDPYGPPGSRVYRTGDRARQRPDGRLEVLGRADDQVKVRGFRVELGEIESALLHHPAVAETAVRLRGGTGAERLVAFVVAADGRPLTAARLRSWLDARLPPYMRPDSYEFLPSLPRNHNGKIDTRALPGADAAPATGAAGEPPAEQRGGPAVHDLTAEQVDVLLRGLVEDPGRAVRAPRH